jgi:hypothetical protein
MSADGPFGAPSRPGSGPAGEPIGRVEAIALVGIPEIAVGDDLTGRIGDAIEATAGVLPLRPDVGRVDPAVGADEAVLGLGDQDAVRHPYDAPRFAQDDLDLARIAIPALGEGDGLGPRLDRVEIDDRTLRLGDDLLGDDEDIVGPERHDPGRRVDRVADPGGEILADPDLRDADEGDGLDATAIGGPDRPAGGCGVSRHRRARRRRGPVDPTGP